VVTFDVGPSSLPPPGRPVLPPVPPQPSRRAPLTAVATLATTVLWGVGWVIAKWMVNTCDEQGVTADDADFVTARTVLVVITLVWATPALIGYLHARRHRHPAIGYLVLASILLAIGAWATITLSSGELCLS
jgi:hypothetical protein